MKGYIKQNILERSLVVNIIAGIVLSMLIVFLFLITLNFWTNHGDYLRIPEIRGKNLKEASAYLEEQGFDIIIQDSIYDEKYAPAEVIKQFPEPDALVKVNRTVYLTINRVVPPMVDMPNLIGMSFRNAEMEMRIKGLKIGDTVYVPDIAKNAVKDQQFEGVTIKPGTPILMGSRITLVLGAGIGNELIPVPDLLGMTYEEARILLEATGINLGVVLPDPEVQDTLSSYIYWQNPSRYSVDYRLNTIRMGQMMDIRLSLSRPSLDSLSQGAINEDQY